MHHLAAKVTSMESRTVSTMNGVHVPCTRVTSSADVHSDRVCKTELCHQSIGVNHVIHWGPTSPMLTFWQEFRRAGHNGKLQLRPGMPTARPMQSCRHRQVPKSSSAQHLCASSGVGRIHPARDGHHLSAAPRKPTSVWRRPLCHVLLLQLLSALLSMQKQLGWLAYEHGSIVAEPSQCNVQKSLNVTYTITQRTVDVFELTEHHQQWHGTTKCKMAQCIT